VSGIGIGQWFCLLKSTYKRYGTINLFAALNVATGAIQSKSTVTQKRPDFQAFLDEVVTEAPIDREIHLILDNYCTHKKNDEWLAAHPNVNFHFTPDFSQLVESSGDLVRHHDA
jgi:hypothetical protein